MQQSERRPRSNSDGGEKRRDRSIEMSIRHRIGFTLYGQVV